jgi:hypothetical protein
MALHAVTVLLLLAIHESLLAYAAALVIGTLGAPFDRNRDR